MSLITLKIHDAADKRKIAKTLTTEGYELMLGTIEDFLNVIDLDKVDNQGEVAKMVVKGYRQIKPLLKDIFPDLTDEDYRNVSLNDMIGAVMEMGTAIIENLNVFKSGN